MPKRPSPTLDWDAHKSIIQALYMDGDESLPNTMKCMEETFGFFATKQQYERQFLKWDFRKNLSAPEYEYIYFNNRRRKNSGKDSSWFRKGTPIPRKKLDKELARRFPPTFHRLQTPDFTVSQRESFSVVTPGHSPVLQMASISSEFWGPSILLLGLPGLQFLESLNSYFGGPFSLDPLSPVVRDHQILPDSRLQTVFSSVGSLKALELIKTCLPEHYVHHLSKALRRPQAPGSDDVLCAFLPFAAYLSSNKLWPRYGLENLIVYIIENGQMGTLLASLSIALPTMDAFKECLVKAAVTLLHPDLLQALSDVGVNPKIFQCRQGSLLLSQCMLHEDQIDAFFSDEIANFVSDDFVNRQIKTVKFLLKAGVQVNDGFFYDQESDHLSDVASDDEESNHFYAAIQWNSELVQILLDAGAKVNVWTHCHDDRDLPKTLLEIEVEDNNFEIVKMMTAAGATVDWKADQLNEEDYAEELLDWADCNSSEEMYLTLCSTAKSGPNRIRLHSILKAADMGAFAVHNLMRSSALRPTFDRALYEAVRQGNIIQVESLLVAGVQPDTMPFGESLLDLAAQSENWSSFVALLNAGAKATQYSVEAVASELEPTHHAMSRLFLATDALDRYGPQALVAAATASKIEVIDHLLSLGIDINSVMYREICTWSGMVRPPKISTAIQAAVFSPDTLRHLIARGADVNKSSGRQPIDRPLLSAISCNNFDSFRLLLDAGACPEHQQNSSGAPAPIQMAARVGNRAMVEALLASGANINSSFSQHSTSLDYSERPFHSALEEAACHGDLALVQYLLTNGADVYANCPEPSCCSILDATYRSIGAGKQKLLHLLEAGADVNFDAKKPSRRCSSLLQSVVRRKDVHLLSTLLGLNADVNCPPGDRFGRTPFQEAIDSEYPDMKIIEILLDAGADVNGPAGYHRGLTALQAAAIRGNLNIAITLIERGAEVNAPGAQEEGRTALEGAAEHGRLDMVQLLLNAGADRPYETAIEFAEEQGHIAVGSFLRSQLA